MEWRLFCENKERARLMFVREFDQGAAGTISVVLMAGSEKSLAFGKFPARAGQIRGLERHDGAGHDQGGARGSQIADRGGIARRRTARPICRSFDIDNSGLQQAWTQLLTSCAARAAGAAGRRIACRRLPIPAR